MITSDGQWAKADDTKPVFIIVEAKRTRTLVESSSEAELIGQLKSQLIRKYIPQQHLRYYPQFSLSICTLTISAAKSHMGALTDGKTWKFYYIVEDRFFYTMIVADTQERADLVLGTCSNLPPTCHSLTSGLLTLFVAGKFPTTNKEDASWVQGSFLSRNLDLVTS